MYAVVLSVLFTITKMSKLLLVTLLYIDLHTTINEAYFKIVWERFNRLQWFAIYIGLIQSTIVFIHLRRVPYGWCEPKCRLKPVVDLLFHNVVLYLCFRTIQCLLFSCLDKSRVASFGFFFWQICHRDSQRKTIKNTFQVFCCFSPPKYHTLINL